MGREALRDTHLTIGIAAAASHLTYYRFGEASRNTFDADTAAAASVFSPRRDEVQVPCVPLSALLDELEVAASLDWSRHRPTVLVIEDFEQFRSGVDAAAPPSAIRSLFAARDYALVAQAVLSSIYVDRHGFAATGREDGVQQDAAAVRGRWRSYPR